MALCNLNLLQWVAQRPGENKHRNDRLQVQGRHWKIQYRRGDNRPKRASRDWPICRKQFGKMQFGFVPVAPGRDVKYPAKKLMFVTGNKRQISVVRKLLFCGRL